MKDILVKFVPLNQQNYATLGDYFDFPDRVEFWIVNTGNDNYNRAVMHHELWEYFEMLKRGVTAQDTCDFDIAHPELDDPGMSLDAPYHKEHCQADVIERMCIVMSGEDWEQYDIDCGQVLAMYTNTTIPVEKSKFPRRCD